MTWGNNGAAPGAQPATPNPTGVQPFAPGVVGQPAGQAGAQIPPMFNSSFESVMAAVSRGEMSLNQVIAANSIQGGAVAAQPAGNPTLLQAMSQGPVQNGTNALGVRSGPAPATEGTAAINIGSVAATAGAQTDQSSTLVVDPRGMVNQPLAIAMANPIQYGGQ